MKPMYRNGLKGHQHIAQGIALGRWTIVKFALKGHKPYHASLCFCPCRAPLLRFALTQDDALGWELYGLPGRPAELPKLKSFYIFPIRGLHLLNLLNLWLIIIIRNLNNII